MLTFNFRLLAVERWCLSVSRTAALHLTGQFKVVDSDQAGILQRSDRITQLNGWQLPLSTLTTADRRQG